MDISQFFNLSRQTTRCMMATLSLVIAFGSSKCWPSIESNVEQNKPNFIFILTDDQTYHSINTLGNNSIETPNLDRLAVNGMSFTHVFNQGSWSVAVCAPSRAMIHTGRHLFRTGFGKKHAQAKLLEFPLLGEVLQLHGYETFITGKWHLEEGRKRNPEALKRSFSFGSKIYQPYSSNKGEGVHFAPLVAEYTESSARLTPPFVFSTTTHSTTLLTDAALDYLTEKRKRNNQPFFLYLSFLAPHDPHQSPKQFEQFYSKRKIQLPENFRPKHPFDQGDWTVRDEVLLPFPRVPAQIKENLLKYYAMITHLDFEIGRLMKFLNTSKYAKNTYVIFTSDNGLASGQHGLLGKQNQYDHSVRVPFIIKGPTVQKNVRKTGMFYINSVFPTILELAGLPVPDTVDAKSIVPLIENDDEQSYEFIYGGYKHFQRMVRSKRYKLIHYPVIQKTQLFDLYSDPFEINSIENNPESGELIDDLFLELERLKVLVGDPLRNDDPIGSFSDFFRGTQGIKLSEL